MISREALEIGMRIAKDHQYAVLEMMKHFPELTAEEALHGNAVWLGTQIMKAIQTEETS